MLFVAYILFEIVVVEPVLLVVANQTFKVTSEPADPPPYIVTEVIFFTYKRRYGVNAT